MPRWLLIALFLTCACARAETPSLLAEAIRKVVADEDHWSYTVTIQRFDRNGKALGGPFVERYDPSRPYREQWLLLKYDGRAPTREETGSWRRQKDRQMRQMDEKSLGDVLDLGHATLAGESGATATFLVPILPGLSKRFPADQLEVFMNIDKAAQALMSFSLQPRGPFRVAGVLKVEAGEAKGRLETVKPGFAPAFVWIKAAGVGRLFGVFRVGRGYEMTLSDYRRVKPYNDRFEVRIGDVKALNF